MSILIDTAALEFFNHYCDTGKYLDESVQGGYWFSETTWFAFDCRSDELYQEEFKHRRYAKLYAQGEESITKQGELI